MKIISQSLVLILSFIFIFLFEMTPLSSLSTQILGLLIVAYLVASLRKRGKGFLSMGGEGPWGIFILNTLIFILIFSTESINSPLFFLLYFLGFGIAFVFEPVTTFIFVLGSILVFTPDILKNDLTNNILKMGSLILISPLAFFFGKEYRRNEQEQSELEALEERTKDAADTISDDIEEVIKDDKQNLKEKDMEKLNEVLEETEDLRQESKL
ncbi:MAG TPA: hypothetical protein VES68_02145 [Candidatus Sulfotelmatobacter sp.]|nr:hypothetical protein [Candidatus Sulfotelmatobacter sp.]